MKKVILAVFLIFLPTWAHADQPSDDPNTVAALQFVNSFWLNWSSAAQVAIPYIDTSVGDRISFFGKSISHREYMRIEESFVRRWPDRNYLMQDGSQAKCDQKTATCVISGTILWSVHNHDTAAQSYGSSKFSFTLREQTIDGQKLFTIIAKSGSDISQTLKEGSQHLASVSQRIAIPAVGCHQSGMGGNMPLEKDIPATVNASPEAASKLAYYYGDSAHVLAPRGWICFSTYSHETTTSVVDGSATTLIVVPPGYTAPTDPVVLYERWDNNADHLRYDEFDQMSEAYGGTYFSALISQSEIQDEVSSVEKLRREIKASDFLIPRYSTNSITQLNSSVFEYETPPSRMGLGIAIGWGLPMNFRFIPYPGSHLPTLPTYGTISLFHDYNWRTMQLLALRLPPGMSSLHSEIQDFVAYCQPEIQTTSCIGDPNANETWKPPPPISQAEEAHILWANLKNLSQRNSP